MRIRPLALMAVLLLGTTSVAHGTTIERQFGYDNGRVRVTEREGYTAVDVGGAGREFRAGRPDLPLVSEQLELPPGMRVAAVELLGLETRLLAARAQVAPALVPTAGLGPTWRSKPDAQVYGTAVFQPDEMVALGGQGDMRGHNLAFLRVSPTQWNPVTGELRVVTGMRVRLTLEADAAPRLQRERIVPEWEDGGIGTGVPTRDLARVLTPLAAGPKGKSTPFVAQQVPSVLGSPVAYVIVTNDVMAPVYQQLADWKTQTGLPAVVRTTSFIRSQYPSAADDAERIRLFIRDCYTRWGTKWVLLGGDADVIPVRLAYTTFYGSEMIATDMYYSCLDGNWNADGDSLYGEGNNGYGTSGDSADLLPEVYVGRAPTVTAADAQVFVNKTMQYERTPVADYEFRWLFFAEVLFPQPWTPGTATSMDGADLSEMMLPLTDQIPELHVTRLYENYTDSTWRAGSLPESRPIVIDSLNSGYGLAMHIGHGYRNIMEVGGHTSLTNADAMALTNGNRLFNLYAINCTSNAIDFPCIGKAFVDNPNGGSVTNVGSTRFDFPSQGSAYQYEYFRLFVEDSVTAVGELQARQKLPFVAYSAYDGVNRWTEMTLLELGDPELRMWRGKPRTLAVGAPLFIALSDTQLTVHVAAGSTPLANARVTVYKAGDDFATATTNGAGNVTLPFRPDSVGQCTVTVTAFNARPFQVNVAIVGSAGPAISEGAVTIHDSGTGGTVGDGNGIADAGETVDIVVPLKNLGGSGATAVNATLSTTNGLVTIVSPTASYGTIAAGTTANPVTPATGFRLALPNAVADQSELPFLLTVVDGAGHSFREAFQVTVRAPELRSYSHGETETVGNQNGRAEAGETVNYTIALRNNGTGTAHNVTLVLRSYDGLASVTDSVASYGDIASGAIVTGNAVTFSPSSSAAVLTAIVSDGFGTLSTQRLDLSFPNTPVSLFGTGAATSIALTWGHVTATDLLGYNVFRSTSSGGTYTKVTVVPTDRISYYTDENLTGLTKYWYRVSAVDSSGNESAMSSTPASASTNPPSHGIFPVPMGRTTPSSVALEYIYSNSQMDIVAGSDFLYLLHADGTAPVDADGQGSTLGDFTNRGSYYAAGPSVGVLEPGQGMSVVGPTWGNQNGANWDSAGVYVFDTAGHVRAGWPFFTNASVWSSAALGDLNGDGKLELCFGSNGQSFYIMRSDGSEWMDGDSNPSTKGVFKVLGGGFNYGTPALADLDGDGRPEIIYGGYDGVLNVWKADGSNFPGFPLTVNGSITDSPAVGYLDGPGDTTPEIVFLATNDSAYVIEPNGLRRAGWPVWFNAHGTTKIPSPAIADMNNDGYNDVVLQSTNGGLYLYNNNGFTLPGMSNLRYSTITSGASESSPVVADINGDGYNDVICGDENGQISAISGANGQMLPGFPIQLSGEVRGAAAVGDIDHDGKTEIVVAGWDRNLYVWDYDFPFQPNGVAPWPQFHHDARRTGFSGAPLYTGGVDAHDPAAAVAVLEFAPPAPNPAVGGSRMWFAIPATMGGATYELAIYDLGGRRVRLVDSGIAKAGRFSLQWDLRDESRRPVEGGVYFARFTVGGHSIARKLVVLQ